MANYVTDGAWGTGLHRLLTAAEIDANFWDAFSTLQSLINNPLQPVSIMGASISGNALTFLLTDGSTFGPIIIPTPAFHWRDEWQPSVFYEQMDVFKVTGVGLYFVLLDHTSGLSFDKTIQVDGSPALLEMFEFAPAENVVYDISIRYPGVLALFPADIAYIVNEPMTRSILLPVTPSNNALHQAYMDTPPSAVEQIFNLYFNDSLIGNVTFETATNYGTVTINSDVTFYVTSRLSVARQANDDPVAAGLSIVLAAQQIVGA